jgi:hypothetical protein
MALSPPQSPPLVISPILSIRFAITVFFLRA